jgi:hypothetical protein
LEEEVLKNWDKPQEFQKGWLITGDNHRLNSGERYHSVYKQSLTDEHHFFIREEIVNKDCQYGSDYYHTRFKDIKNAEKYILDCKENKYNQFQIKHACIHLGIEIDKIQELYRFLNRKAI